MQGYQSKTVLYSSFMVKLSPVLHDWHMHFIPCQTRWLLAALVMATPWRGEKLERISRFYGTLLTYSKCANVRAVLILGLHRYYYSWTLRHIPDRHPHSKHQFCSGKNKHLQNYITESTKSIYKIQKECFYRVNLEETTIPFLWKWNNKFMWLWNKKLLVRHLIGPHRCSRGAWVHKRGGKNGTWQKWQEKKLGKDLIQNTPLSNNQTCNTCGGKYISSRTQGLFAWENLIVKEHKHMCCTGIRTSQSKTMACKQINMLALVAGCQKNRDPNRTNHCQFWTKLLVTSNIPHGNNVNVKGIARWKNENRHLLISICSKPYDFFCSKNVQGKLLFFPYNESEWGQGLSSCKKAP